MKKSYSIKKVDKILRELDAYRHSLAYLTSVEDTAGMSLTAAETWNKRIRYLRRTIAAVEHSLQLLDDTERNIISKFYFEPEHSFDSICEECALEKSSVYRYRSRALAKMAAAMFGEG
ncbi:MAG: hypothetical protein ACI4V1_05795 [Eubacteriales bacterium]